MPQGFGDKRNFVCSIIKSYKDKLYIGTGKSSLVGCEIQEYNGQNLKKVVEKGFGNRFNNGVWPSIVYYDELCVGIMNWKQECQIWKTNNGINWINIVGEEGIYKDGFGDIYNKYG